jgi:CDP-glucose 4,6-dehydratase
MAPTAPPLPAELQAAYAGKRVLVTGHTGFKGSWLALWLSRLGARVTGLALAPETTPSAFDLLDVAAHCVRHQLGDIRDPSVLSQAVRDARPDFVFHLAAQALVRRSYAEPIATLETNIMGTAHLLEALREAERPATVVVVTTDKCYENREWVWGYREQDALGGHDPYSASKAGAEIVVSTYRRSFFPPAHLGQHGVALASARAGNVIGGGDWSQDRIVPDAIRALGEGRPIPVRNPASIRPWQHVLEPLGGYLLLGARMATGDVAARAALCDAWNFGPAPEAARPVRDLVDLLIASWGEGRWEDRSDPSAPHEGAVLRLAIDKAVAHLGWRPRWDFRETIARTAAWYRAFLRGGGAAARELVALSSQQIAAYESSESSAP